MNARTIRRRALRWLAKGAVGVLCATVLVMNAVWIAIVSEPYPIEDLAHTAGDSMRIRDREGKLLREVVNGEGTRLEWTPLHQISPLVVDATIAVEDERFFQHRGVDPIAVLR